MNEETQSKSLTAEQLKLDLFHFTGSEVWYRHPLNQQMLYTDGVRYFAEHGGEQGAYWLIDKVAFDMCPVLVSKKEWFASVTLVVNTNGTAVVNLSDGNYKIIRIYEIHYTDMQIGEWTFLLSQDGRQWIMLLPTEY